MTIADDRALPGLTDHLGHRVTRASIDRALTEHAGPDGPVVAWSYTDPRRHLRHVLLTAGHLDNVTDAQALALTVGLTAARRLCPSEKADIAPAPRPDTPGGAAGVTCRTCDTPLLRRPREPGLVHANGTLACSAAANGWPLTVRVAGRVYTDESHQS